MRYTAVFEFEAGKEPRVNKGNGWLGGKLCAVQFNDALIENERLKNQDDDARQVIARGLALMSDRQAGEWEGVRHWLEADLEMYLPEAAA